MPFTEQFNDKGIAFSLTGLTPSKVSLGFITHRHFVSRHWISKIISKNMSDVSAFGTIEPIS